MLIIHRVIKQILKFFLQEIDLLRIKKTVPIIIIGFIVAIFFSLFAIAATDAPHNASNNISCGSCHGETLMNSPFWGTGTYDQLCLSCHRRATGGPYSQTDAPAVTTHSDSSENALAECRDCHNPHYQRQKVYKNTDASNLYLATGKIISCEYSGKDPFTNKDISTFHYSDNPPITYKSGTGWDATKLPKKTEDYRGAILFPHVNKLGYNYPITAVNPTAKTITVNGNVTTECNNNLFSSATFAVMYGQYIKDVLNTKTVKFFDQTGTNSFADGDTTYNGVCEVCHTQTTHFRYGGGVPEQNHENICEGVRTNCIRCHKHTNGFGHGGGGSETNCVDCHGHENDWTGGPYSGTTLSHSTHTENDSDDAKGPFITTCGGCHAAYFPCFKSGVDSNGDEAYNLSETNVCDGCHSLGGAFNGVISVGGSVGARDNWVKGIYQDDGTLTPGKEKWCAGCHDNVPSVVKVTTAPDIVGDNSAYGYYLDAHGNVTYGVSRKNVSYSKGECLHCHDVSVAGHGGQLFDTSINFCFKCHDNTTTYATAAIKNRSYSYRAGGYTTDTLNNLLSAFSLTSSHKLSDIKTFINGKWGYTSSSNPCDACHNPHIVQGDPANLPNSAKSSDTRGWPVSRPSEHATNYNNLWGDIASEKMSDYTSQYQAPYRYGSTSNYEPDDSSTQNGSNLTDYNTFCTDCHNTAYTIYSTTLNRNLKTIDWITSAGESGGDKHGKNIATDTAAASIHLKNPYLGVWTAAGLVLACTDCHEPHGSPNVFLLRNEVNGGVLSDSITAFSLNLCSFPGTDGNKVLGRLCNRCHKDDYDLDPSNYPTPNTWKYVHHYGSGFPYDRAACYRCHYVDLTQQPISCNCCHYHGSSTTDYGAAYPCKLYPTLCDDSSPIVIDRRTF